MSFSPELEMSYNGRNQRNSIFSTPKWPSSRRSHSLSSSSSSLSSSFLEDSPPVSPSTTLRRVSGGGIPFSWEQIPGIPKKQILKKIDSTRNNNNNNNNKPNYLPLPPAIAPVYSGTCKSNHNKKHINRRDPFFTALVECSKGGDNGDDDDDKEVFGSIWKGAKPVRSISDRLGFVNFSCKNSSVITESLVFLPRGHRRITYDMIKKRSG